TGFDLDSLTLDGVRSGVLHGRSVTVLGFARTGVALARFFVDAGARVTIYDGRLATELADSIAALGGRSVGLLLGPEVDPANAWRTADLVTTSPSVSPDYPTTESRLRAALTVLRSTVATRPGSGPPIVSEPDLVLRLAPGPTIGVTGTKGKTTTASLAADLLAADRSHPVALGGNIGRPLVDLLPELTPEHRVVIELSELQLPTLSRGTTVATYTNVTSDHLDRHGTLAAYRAVKRRLAELVDPDGALVLNADDPVVASYAALGAGPSLMYRLERPMPGGLGIVDGWIAAAGVERLPLAGGGAAWTGPGGRIMPAAELAIPGRHNLSNVLAAIGVALLFGVAPDAIREAAAAFPGVEHRLELVAEDDGVRYVNDSQGTQPDAVIAALRAFDGPIVLIAGGRDKDVDLSGLAPVVAERAAAVVLIGESAPLLAGLFREAGVALIERAVSLEDAVARADALARAAIAGGPAKEAPQALAKAQGQGPATVLLSPAAASFDMFVDYAARGRAFRTAVRRLIAERSAGLQSAGLHSGGTRDVPPHGAGSRGAGEGSTEEAGPSGKTEGRSA
ncbi:MAG TPA: UDP-N-acetylmuramoyl-L-alanine--D-glutamate ligase, partial [Candidatus Saccharimonadales bacterium]|nr:UDP-N-acetylmuramoyl-L-alanine--D-glutamate ligase [Candidatus Saccharimonadales bacterium]